MRTLLLAHRYLGIALGALMVMWCLSGAVMMYVPYPALSQASRLQALEPIDWSHCCALGDDALGDAERVARFQVEMLAGVPVLRLEYPFGEPRLVDLADGTVIGSISPAEARRVAADYGRAHGYRGPLRLEGLIDYDEWTVSGEFNADRPLFRFRLGDAAQTEVYVSSVTGRIVQATTAHQRFWNWLGAVPHWLYFAELRHDASLWSRIVIYTSLGGSLLAAIGIYLGLRRFLQRPSGRWSPYRGVMLWHHLPGLFFGVFALTWVASGLLSLNPWGVLENSSARLDRQLLVGALPTGRQVKESLRALGAAMPAAGIVSIDSAPLLGRLYLVATDNHGSRRRLDARALAKPIQAAEIVSEARAIAGGEMFAGPELLSGGDNYYFSYPGDTVPLPVYRIVLKDEQRTRFYLSSVSGALIEKIDRNGRGYRWLYEAPHRLDFSPALRARPFWDVLMLVLLSGVTVLCTTGAFIGLRRLARDVRGAPGTRATLH